MADSGSRPDGDFANPREELSSIVRDLKAHLSWLEVSGATGVPRDPEWAARQKENPLPRFAPDDWASTIQEDEPTRTNEARSTEQERRLPPGPSEGDPAARPPFALPEFDNATTKKSAPPQAKVLPHLARQTDKTHLISLGSSLDEVRAHVAACSRCDLHQQRKQTVFSRGTGSSGLCFIGEGPGEDEDAQGEPFVGAAGQLLDKMILAMGMTRDEVYVCNVVKCRPPNNRRPTPVEMQTCSPYLERQVELLQPQVIVALGGTAVAGLLGLTEGITQIRGRFRLYQGRIAVMPTFHPAYLLRNPAAKRHVWTDLQQVLQHLGRKLPPRD